MSKEGWLWVGVVICMVVFLGIIVTKTYRIMYGTKLCFVPEGDNK